MRQPQNVAMSGSVTSFTPAVSLVREQHWLRVVSNQFPEGRLAVAGPFDSKGESDRFKAMLERALPSINSELGISLSPNQVVLGFEPFECVTKPEGVEGRSTGHWRQLIKSLFWSNPKQTDPSFEKMGDA